MLLPKYEDVLLQCFLFSGFSAERLALALSGRGEIAAFNAGQTIFSPHSFKRAVGIFLQGKAQAETAAEGRIVVLNRFQPPMMFGAAAVFRQAQEYVTQVTAKTRCRVLFLTDEELDALLRFLDLFYSDLGSSYLWDGPLAGSADLMGFAEGWVYDYSTGTTGSRVFPDVIAKKYASGTEYVKSVIGTNNTGFGNRSHSLEHEELTYFFEIAQYLPEQDLSKVIPYEWARDHGDGWTRI